MNAELDLLLYLDLVLRISDLSSDIKEDSPSLNMVSRMWNLSCHDDSEESKVEIASCQW